MKIAHIINPVKAGKDSDLNIAQPVTFSTMQKAKDQSEYSEHIKLYATGYSEDREVFPPDFIALPDLTRSVLDVGSFQSQRKLPLLADILSPLAAVDDAEYIIFSNVDIGLMPYFYDYILKKIAHKNKALIINKRIIQYSEHLPEMYSQMGTSHPGYDCFIFEKKQINKFELGNACIGARFIGLVFYLNLLVFCRNVEVIRDAHLTFHIGDDRSWDHPNHSEYEKHNGREALGIIDRLIQKSTSAEINRVLETERSEIARFLAGKKRHRLFSRFFKT